LVREYGSTSGEYFRYVYVYVTMYFRKKVRKYKYFRKYHNAI
jgi:hypothetical protein